MHNIFSWIASAQCYSLAFTGEDETVEGNEINDDNARNEVTTIKCDQYDRNDLQVTFSKDTCVTYSF